MKTWIASFSVVAVGFCLSAGNAWARLGADEATLTGLFGYPIARGMENVMVKGKLVPSFTKLDYEKEGWKVSCVLVDERCAKASYGREGDWTEEMLADLLRDNAQGSTWSADPEGSKLKQVVREWVRSDGGTAKWRKNLGITLISPAFTNAEKEVKQRERNNGKVLPKS